MASGPLRLRPLLAGELSLVAPARAVKEVVPLLPAADMLGRRLLRKALSYATRSPSAAGPVRELLADPNLPEVAAIDLLRALGDRAPAHQPEAARALTRLSRPEASFRTRYLLIGTAAALADVDPAARAVLVRSLLNDPSGNVRAESARRIRHPERYRNELERALSDPEVRVREAALVTLQSAAASFASAAVTARLAADRWPMVRSAAATALAHYAADPQADGALAKALTDAAPSVRGRAVLALGERGAASHAEAVRERLEDADEIIDVRVNAAIALGLMCDAGSVDVLVDRALRLRDPTASAEDRAIGPAAIGALGRIHPADLAEASLGSARPEDALARAPSRSGGDCRVRALRRASRKVTTKNWLETPPADIPRRPVYSSLHVLDLGHRCFGFRRFASGARIGGPR